MKKKKGCLLAVIAMIFVFATAGCGEKGNVSGTEDGGPKLVYVPEYLEMKGEGEGVISYDVLQNEDSLCHPVLEWEDGKPWASVSVHRHFPARDSLSETKLTDRTTAISNWTMGADGSMYFLMVGWHGEAASEQNVEGTVLVKYGKPGNRTFWKNVTEYLPAQDSYRVRIAVDGGGRIYLLTQEGIQLFDDKGDYNGKISLKIGDGLYASGFGRGGDGAVYISNVDGDLTAQSTTLYQVDFEDRKLGAEYENFPSSGGPIAIDAAGDLLTYDTAGLYTYHMESHTAEKLLEWTDSGIDAGTVSAAGALSDGRVTLFCKDWATQKNSLAILSGVDVATLPEKQELVLGCLFHGDSQMDYVISAFNQNSKKYHITTRYYLENINDDQQAARARMQADIISDNCPDIFEATSLPDLDNLAEKGAFEDLTPYLEKSSVINREDYFENLLDQYTFDGLLVSIPKELSFFTYVGSREALGDEMGWTTDEVIAFCDAHPDAELIQGFTSSGILRFCTEFSLDSFVDWDHGTCDFTKDEFKRLLEFAARFRSSDESLSINDGLQSGKILLNEMSMWSVDGFQTQMARFQGDVTPIGFPSSDGRPVHTIYGDKGLSISSKCAAKEGAWEFIEFFLSAEERHPMDSLSTNKKALEDMIARESEYLVDSEGNPILDENGNYLPKNQKRISFKDGTEYYYSIPTQREIDMIYDLINTGVRRSQSDNTVLDIILQEAPAYFSGQKSLDAVIDGIQQRVQLYLNENKQ